MTPKGRKARNRRRVARNARRLGSLAIAACSLPVGVLPMLAAESAHAFPNDQNLCQFDDVEFTFPGGNWDSHKADWLTGGRRWNVVQAPQGGAPWFAGEGSYHPVYRHELGGTTLGHTDCDLLGGLYFGLDDDVAAGASTRRVGAHETGHAHGLEHSGEDDSFNGDNPPVMATCQSDTSSALSQDDYAAVLANEGATVHANSSFENGVAFWGTGNMDLEWHATGGVEGPAYAKATAQGAGSHSVFQTVRTELPSRYRARVNYKDGNSEVNDVTLTIVIQARRVEFSGSNGCNYPGDFDYISPSFPGGSGFTDMESLVVTVPDSWSYNSSFPGWDPPSSWEAADIRLRVYKNGGAPVLLDHARAFTY